MSALDDGADLISTCGMSSLKLSTWKTGVGSSLMQEDDDKYNVMAEFMLTSLRLDDGWRYIA